MKYLLLLLCLTGCTTVSTIKPMDDGRDIKVTEVKFLGVVVDSTEEIIPTPAEERNGVITELMKNGMWIVTIGSLIAAVGIAIGIYTQNPFIDRIAWPVAVIGGCSSGAGVILMGLSLYFTIIIAILFVAGIAYAWWRRR